MKPSECAFIFFHSVSMWRWKMASVLKVVLFSKARRPSGGESVDSVRRILCIFLVSENVLSPLRSYLHKLSLYQILCVCAIACYVLINRMYSRSWQAVVMSSERVCKTEYININLYICVKFIFFKSIYLEPTFKKISKHTVNLLCACSDFFFVC